MCKKYRTIVHSTIGKDAADERVHNKVHILKEIWAKEKLRKVQKCREKRDVELNMVKMFCQQAVCHIPESSFYYILYPLILYPFTVGK